MTLLPLNATPMPPGVGVACVRKTVKKNNCRACIDACPLQAIGLENQTLTINEDQCNHCGRCLFVCPTDALENIHPVRRYWRDDRLVGPLSAQPAGVEELLLWHYLRGIRAIELEAAQEGWLRAVAELNLVLKTLNQPTWQLAAPGDSPVNAVRRQWLRMRDDAINSGSVPHGRRALRDALTGTSLYAISFNQPQCYLCGACARICPEQAIRLHQDRFTLDNARCTGCGQCAVVCFPHAIQVAPQHNCQPAVRLPFGQQVCGHCRQTFNAWSDDASLCPFCQQHTFGMR